MSDSRRADRRVHADRRIHRTAAALWLSFALLFPPAAAVAQAPAPGEIEGRLTDSYSKPLHRVRLVLRNLLTGADFTTTTAESGSYRLGGLPPGPYVLEVSSAQLGTGETSGIVVSAGHITRIQTAIALHAPHPQSMAAAAVMPSHATAPSPAVPVPAAQMALNSPEPWPLPIGSPASSRSTAAGAYSSGVRSGAILATVASASLIASSRFSPRNSARPTVRIDLAEARPFEDAITGEDLQVLPLAAGGSEPFRIDTLPQPPVGSELPGAGDSLVRAADSRAVLVDGMDMRLGFGRGSGKRDPAALRGPAANQAAILELHLVSPVQLDAFGYSRTEAGMRTRGGQEPDRARVHAQAFLFNRQNLLNARNPMTQWITETAAATPGTIPAFTPIAWSPADRELRWGGGAGGPLRRDSLFWYGAFSRETRNHPAVATVRHADHFFATPPFDEMQVLSARLDLSSADPVGEGLAAYSGMLETLDGLLGPAARASSRSTDFARLDWNAARRHRLQFEASTARWDAPGGGLTNASEMYGSHSFGASKSRELWLMGLWDMTLSRSVVAVSQIAVGNYALQHPASTPSGFEETLNVNPWRQLPQMVVDSRYGFSIGNPARFGAGTYPREHLYEFRETVDWLRGPVTFRAGADLRHNADSTSFVRNHTGTYHYSRLENFVSDALVFARYGLADALDPTNQHNCDSRGKAWRDSNGELHGLGYLPCYSYYTQTLGPTDWHLETNDWNAFAAAAWQARPGLRLSAALQWDWQEMPPPIPLVRNPDLPQAGRLPDPGNEWAPRVGMAWGSRESRWPVLALGYGLSYGRVQNRTLEEALTQTGSPAADLKVFLRPTDNLAIRGDGAPPFPYVLAGSPGTALKPGASILAPGFRNAEVHQAFAAAEKTLPGRVDVSVTTLLTLGRRLPLTMDINFDPAVNPGTITYEVADPASRGPIHSPRITVPFFAAWPSAGPSGGRLNPSYQEITQLASRANFTSQSAILRLTRRAARGVGFNVRYAYGHAMDWNPNESGLLTGGDVLDPLDLRQEYGPSNLDIRHSASGYAVWRAPWRISRPGGRLANGWMLSAVGQFHSGLPYSMRTEGGIPALLQPGRDLVVGLGPGMNGYGGANRVYGITRNAYRYPPTWVADVRLGKNFPLGQQHQLELLAETFNLFNHRNVTEIESVGYTIDTPTTSGSLPRLNFLTNAATGEPEFGLPLDVNATDPYRERQVDFGLRLRFKH